MKPSALKVAWYDGYPARYRPDTSDEKILRGLILKSDYRMVSIGFDVKQGERWLDLGANVGAFAIYCKIRNATTVCYEPDPDCFAILEKNAPWSELHQACVTNQQTETLAFNVSTRKDNHYRGSILKNQSLKFKAEVANVYGGDLKDQQFDGVKMDIEGAELGLLDDGLILPSKKLVMEYHCSRDDNPANMKRRLDYLRSLYQHVKYQAWLDRRIAAGQSVKNLMDPVIFCWGLR